MDNPNLFETHMGDKFGKLSPMIQNAHLGQVMIEGPVTVSRGNILARLVCNILGFPETGTEIRLIVKADHQADQVNWKRNFNGQVLNSCFRRKGDYVYEQMGPIRMYFKLEPENGALNYNLLKVKFWGIRLPKLVSPKLMAYEMEADNKYRFKVKIVFPVFGKLIEYYGDLELSDPE